MEKKHEFEEKILIKEKKKWVEKDSFADAVGKACKGLYYVSETDAEILPFFGGKVTGGPRETILREIGLKNETTVEERAVADLFSRLTKIREWFTPVEHRNAKKFLEMQKLLEDNLEDLTVLRIGRIQIDIYVVGIDKARNLAGIKTKAVET